MSIIFMSWIEISENLYQNWSLSKDKTFFRLVTPYHPMLNAYQPVNALSVVSLVLCVKKKARYKLI